MARVVAVIPAFNEASVIGDVISGLRSQVDEVVVVDDGSSDETGSRAQNAGAKVLRHIINRGQGAALATGMRYALQHNADVVVHFDADGQHDPTDVSRLVGEIEKGMDVALGSRFLGKAQNLPLSRWITLKLGLVFTYFFSGLRLTDPQSGLRALSRSAALQLQITQDGMAHASEILDAIADHHLKYIEVPITVRYTAYSMSRGQGNLNAIAIVKKLILQKFFN